MSATKQRWELEQSEWADEDRYQAQSTVWAGVERSQPVALDRTAWTLDELAAEVRGFIGGREVTITYRLAGESFSVSTTGTVVRVIGQGRLRGERVLMVEVAENVPGCATYHAVLNLTGSARIEVA